MPLSTSLTTLETSGLIRLAQMELELEYFFRHALVQETTYNSILKSDRRTLHRMVGVALENFYSQPTDEMAPALARHFSEAGEDDIALRYFIQAADAAFRVFANAEAVQYYSHALILAARVEIERSLLTHLYLQYGRALELLGRYDEVLDNYERMTTVARQRDDNKMELIGLVELTKLRALPSAKYDPPLGRVLAEQTLSLARQLGDKAIEARILWNILILHLFSLGDLAEGVACAEESLALTRSLGLREQMAYTLNDLGYAYLCVGQFANSFQMLEEACELWREMGNTPMLASALTSLMQTYFFSGDLTSAIALSDEAFELCRSVQNIEGQGASRFLTGLVYAEQGHFAECIAVVEEATPFAEQVGLLAFLVGTRAELGWVYGQMGAVEHGLTLAETALNVARTSIPLLAPWALAISARLHLRQGRLDEAAAALTEAEPFRDLVQKPSTVPMQWVKYSAAHIEMALAQHDIPIALREADALYTQMDTLGFRPVLPEILTLRAAALRASGQSETAYQSLLQARTIAEAISARRSLWQVLVALSEMEAERGHRGEAHTLREQAHETLAYIADHCPPEFRASFLNLPDVKQVWNVT